MTPGPAHTDPHQGEPGRLPAALRPVRRPLVLSLVLLLVLLAQTVTGADQAAAVRYADDTFERALAAFAVSRALNAAISVIQETEVGFSAVVSASVQPGQILDPVNDLVERFPWSCWPPPPSPWPSSSPASCCWPRPCSPSSWGPWPPPPRSP